MMDTLRQVVDFLFKLCFIVAALVFSVGILTAFGGFASGLVSDDSAGLILIGTAVTTVCVCALMILVGVVMIFLDGW